MLATVMTRPAGVIAIVAVNVYSVYGSVRYLTLEHPLRWGSLELLTAANILLGTVLAVALFSMRNWARWVCAVLRCVCFLAEADLLVSREGRGESFFLTSPFTG